MSGLPVPTTTVCAAALAATAMVAIAENSRRQSIRWIRFMFFTSGCAQPFAITSSTQGLPGTNTSGPPTRRPSARSRRFCRPRSLNGRHSPLERPSSRLGSPHARRRHRCAPARSQRTRRKTDSPRQRQTSGLLRSPNTPSLPRWRQTPLGIPWPHLATGNAS